MQYFEAHSSTLSFLRLEYFTKTLKMTLFFQKQLNKYIEKNAKRTYQFYLLRFVDGFRKPTF